MCVCMYIDQIWMYIDLVPLRLCSMMRGGVCTSRLTRGVHVCICVCVCVKLCVKLCVYVYVYRAESDTIGPPAIVLDDERWRVYLKLIRGVHVCIYVWLCVCV